MSTEKTYNGWTNYATWRVNLEVVDDYLNSIVSDAHHGYVERYASVYELAEHIKTYVDDVLTDWESVSDSLALDYARVFVLDVNWYEIASHWTDELIEQWEDEEHDIFISSQREADELGLQVIIPEFGCNVIVSRA